MPKVSNATRLPQDVRIILEDKRVTHIKVMPGSRPDLPPGAVVDPNWLAVNPKAVHIIKSEAEKREEQQALNPAARPSPESRPSADTGNDQDKE